MHNWKRWIRLVAVYGFGWLVLAAAVIGLFWPGSFAFARPHIPLLLGVVMFGMGMTLRAEDFRRVLGRPLDVIAGCGAQYLIMPLAGWFLAMVFRFPPEVAVGFILLGACPGGTASNVIVFLGRGDVALSVTLTAVSTLLAPVLTPLLTWQLAGERLEVPVLGLFRSILEIVVAPIVVGVLVQRWLPGLARACLPLLPLVSVAVIAIIVGAILGANADLVLAAGVGLGLAVVLHNGFGLGLGYGLARLLRRDPGVCRAVAVEVGMQNSGLAATLALAHLSPAAAIPGALFSVWHNLSGAFLATFWGRRNNRMPPATTSPSSCGSHF